MSSKMFPIATATACRLKWAWSSLYLNSAYTTSCHRASSSQLTVDNFYNFHNTSVKIQDRQTMLQGNWPGRGCEYCKDIESAGGTSDRLFQNQIPSVYPSELDIDSTLVHVKPTVLEVFFSNTCNLKCVYCKGTLSSAIQQEDNKFGSQLNAGASDQTDSVNHYRELAPLFWQWFEEHSQSLMRLQVLGGEPLLQQDFIKLLDFFEQYPHPKLEFNIVTNLNLPNSLIAKVSNRLENLLQQKKLARVDILASVDAWGQGQEYVRSGFDRNLFDTNMQTISQHRRFRIGILSTVCSLTIPEMPALAKKRSDWNKMQPIFWYMHLVLPEDTVLSPTIFDRSLFVEYLLETKNILPLNTWDDKQTQDLLDGIIKTIQQKAHNNADQQGKLLQYLNEVDRRRNLNWKTAFPWLTEFFEDKCYVVQ